MNIALRNGAIALTAAVVGASVAGIAFNLACLSCDSESDSHTAYGQGGIPMVWTMLGSGIAGVTCAIIGGVMAGKIADIALHVD